MIGLWQQEHEVAARFPGKWFIFLSSSLSWGLHCILSFTIIASHPGHTRVPCRASNPATHWLGSVAFWSLIVKSCNTHTLASFMPRKSASHGLRLLSLLAGDGACTSWITAPIASVCLYGWGLENTSLEIHANAHCYEGLLCLCNLFTNDSFTDEFELLYFGSVSQCMWSHPLWIIFVDQDLLT